ncbi:MAG: HEAT repeat domain-containing protein [Leptolyngbyaceae cyanobacterium RU_5_1]|nr:HEAT repeat domain-containing protein [Leptolyngbyaceae cyanobacterium RU_5_1]
MTNDLPINQLQEAAQRGDWSQLIQSLQQLLLTEQVSELPQNDVDALLTLAVVGLETADFQMGWEIAKVFPVFGDRAIAPLVSLLQDEAAELESRWFAARILGDLNNPAAIQALVDQLQASDDEDLREMAAGALANLGTAAIAALTDLLAEDTTRSSAVQALAQIRHSETIAPLLTVADDPQPAVRTLVVEALSSFHDSRIPPMLVRALHDPAAPVRQAAIAGLSVRLDLSDQLNLVPLLSEYLWDLNLSVCQQSAIALGRLRNDAAIPPLVRAFQSPTTPEVLQLEILRSLGWIGTQAALDTLQQFLASNGQPALSRSTYHETVATLGRWADPNLKPVAAQVLTHELVSPSFAQQDAGIRQRSRWHWVNSSSLPPWNP